MTWPKTGDKTGKGPEFAAARRWLQPFLASGGRLRSDPDTIELLLAAWAEAPAKLRRALRVSRHFGAWLERSRRERQRVEARAAFEAELASGKATLDVLHHKLLPYQCEGVLHLAFG
jgi:hypothetical protein